jgi:hypothetical protein
MVNRHNIGYPAFYTILTIYAYGCHNSKPAQTIDISKVQNIISEVRTDTIIKKDSLESSILQSNKSTDEITKILEKN